MAGHFSRTLLLGLLPCLVAAGPNRARMPTTVRDESLERYVGDLLGTDPQNRAYAARTLRAQLKITLRQYDRAREGSLGRDDAAGVLDDYDALVAPACMQVLGTRGTTSACADILGWLETQDALPMLEALSSAPPTHCAGRRIHRAIARIQAAKTTP